MEKTQAHQTTTLISNVLTSALTSPTSATALPTLSLMPFTNPMTISAANSSFRENKASPTILLPDDGLAFADEANDNFSVRRRLLEICIALPIPARQNVATSDNQEGQTCSGNRAWSPNAAATGVTLAVAAYAVVAVGPSSEGRRGTDHLDSSGCENEFVDPLHLALLLPRLISGSA